MSWFQKICQEVLPNDELSNSEYFGGISTFEGWNARYPVAGGVVGRLSVISDIPNTESISSSMENWQELPGIREVPLADLGSSKPREVFYDAKDIESSHNLAEEIRNSGQISPLIIGIDEYPYILEGIHRFVALGLLGVESFPALVVLNKG